MTEALEQRSQRGDGGWAVGPRPVTRLAYPCGSAQQAGVMREAIAAGTTPSERAFGFLLELKDHGHVLFDSAWPPRIVAVRETWAQTVAEYRRIMAINVDAYFFLAQAAIPHLLERNGNIVNVASNSALQGIPYAVPYAISKGGVVQLTRALAVEFLTRPLRVNAIETGKCCIHQHL